MCEDPVVLWGRGPGFGWGRTPPPLPRGFGFSPLALGSALPHQALRDRDKDLGRKIHLPPHPEQAQEISQEGWAGMLALSLPQALD